MCFCTCNSLKTNHPGQRYILPGCEIAWGLITIGTYKVSSPTQLYLLRFFLGLLEGTSFVGIQYVLGSWYKSTELGKRTAIFANSAYIGTAFGGYIFSGVLASMDGYQGASSWWSKTFANDMANVFYVGKVWQLGDGRLSSTASSPVS